MTITTITGPAAEPLTLGEAKAHLRLTAGDEDDLVNRLITTARQHIEGQTGLRLIIQHLRHSRDDWPQTQSVALPVYPVRSIDAVRTLDDRDAPTALNLDHTYLVAATRPARLMLRSGRRWPAIARQAGGIEIDLTAGFGAAPEDVPEPLRQATAQLVAHWFENREPVSPDAAPAPVPQMVAALLAPYRPVRLT